MREGELLVVKANYWDKKGKFDVQDPKRLLAYVKNIYKVLLTRGIKGTYVYVCDEELRAYFKRFIPLYFKERSYGEVESMYLNAAERNEKESY